MEEKDKLALLEAFVLKHGPKYGLRDGAAPEVAKRLLYSKNFSFDGDRFIEGYAVVELMEQSLACKHLFKTDADDDKPAPAPPTGKQLYGMPEAEFLKLPPAERLRLAELHDQRQRDVVAAHRQAQIDQAVADSVKGIPDFYSWRAERRAAHADAVAAKAKAAMEKAGAL